MTINKQLLEALELLIDNISAEEWEALPPYIEQRVIKAFYAAKNAEKNNA